MSAEPCPVFDLSAYRRVRAERDHRTADALQDLDVELGEAVALQSEWARVLAETPSRSKQAQARRFIRRLRETRAELEAERRGLLTPRLVGVRR